MNDQPTKVIDQKDRDFYAENGYLVLEKRLPSEMIDRLRHVTDEITDRPKNYLNPADDDSTYWELAANSILVDIVSDLIGPNIAFRKSTLYFQSIKTASWHQDMPYNPHTNLDILVANVHLYDCDPETARLRLIPGSHREGFLETMKDGNPKILETEVENIDLSRELYLCPPAGSIEIMDYSMIHQDGAGGLRDGNYVPMFGYSAADSFPLSHYPHNSKYTGAIVRGHRTRFPRFDSTPCPIPPPMDERLRVIPEADYRHSD